MQKKEVQSSQHFITQKTIWELLEITDIPLTNGFKEETQKQEKQKFTNSSFFDNT